MISERTLRLAVEQTLLSNEQVQGLKALEHTSSIESMPVSVDDERIRFIAGFADVFVAIGLMLFVGASGYFLGQTFGPIGMWTGAAVISWLLAEFFTRRRRMAFPSILLLLSFAGSVFMALLTGIVLLDSLINNVRPSARDIFSLGNGNSIPVVISALLTSLAIWAHYRRFNVPITVAAGVAALAGAGLALVYASAPMSLAVQLVPLATLMLGLAVFALAMRFDMSDPSRETRRSDIAFWLHMLAAPMIVHAIIATLFGDITKLAIGGALSVLGVFVALGIVAIALDRRAMLVSGLFYAGAAFGAVLKQAVLTNFVIPATLLALGSFILLVSAGWRPLRSAIIRALPSSIADHLPPISSTTTS
jgi:hypothetical protein